MIIDKDGKLIVRAPLKCKDSEIFDFINKKQNWIIKKQNERKLRPNNEELKIEDGKTINLLGKTYYFSLQNVKRTKILNNQLVLPNQEPKLHLVDFLKKLSKNYIKTRVEEIEKMYNFDYKTIRISSAKTNWGSCSYKNSLNFTYKLMLCPTDIVDYIIVHELTHTKIKNHSKQFYNLVGKIIPDYKEKVKWLKQHSYIVNLI